MIDKIATIRPYEIKDYDRLREVCRVTATGHYKNKPELTPLLFCEYYLERESEHCFAVADKDDNAVGYIICAPDYKKYVAEYTKYMFPKIRKISLIEVIIRKLEFMYMSRIARNYPAHLHIDILPEFQRMGLGLKLLNTLMLHLEGIGVKKLHLGCSADNEKGVNFYYKTGFHVVKKIAGVIIFGIDISEYVSKIKNNV